MNEMQNFTVTDKDQKKIDKWLKETVYPRWIELQKTAYSPENPTPEHVKHCWDLGEPYTGAIGGGLSYIFSPTSIGTTLVVKFGEDTLDLTDYEAW